MRTFLKENPQIADEIEHKIRENAGIISNEMMTPPEASSVDVDSDEGLNGEDSVELQAGA